MSDNHQSQNKTIRTIVFIILCIAVYFSTSWYQQKLVMDNYVEKANFLEANNGTWAERCNAYMMVKSRASTEQNKEIYSEYQKRYDENNCDPTINPLAPRN